LCGEIYPEQINKLEYLAELGPAPEPRGSWKESARNTKKASDGVTSYPDYDFKSYPNGQTKLKVELETADGEWRMVEDAEFNPKPIDITLSYGNDNGYLEAPRIPGGSWEEWATRYYLQDKEGQHRLFVEFRDSNGETNYVNQSVDIDLNYSYINGKLIPDPYF
jgi:hypothetical protein